MVFILAILIVVLDQATKFIVSNWPGELPLEIIKGVFAINLVYNKGGAFGIFNNQLPLFIVISLLSIALIVRFLTVMKRRGKAFPGSRNPRFPHTKFIEISLSLILGGAIGNLIDRIRLGCVIDFLDFKVWPVFNVADSAISIGVTILLIELALTKRKGAHVSDNF